MKQVKLGGRVLGSAGCVSYSDASEASSTDTGSSNLVYIIVLVGSIGIAIIVLLIAIVLRAFLRCRRRVDEDQQPLGVTVRPLGLGVRLLDRAWLHVK